LGYEDRDCHHSSYDYTSTSSLLKVKLVKARFEAKNWRYAGSCTPHRFLCVPGSAVVLAHNTAAYPLSEGLAICAHLLLLQPAKPGLKAVQHA
jgi:hypothetical protein